MIVEGGGLPIRDKLLKLVEGPDSAKSKKGKGNGKAKSEVEKKTDILEVSAENIRASKVKLSSFEEAVKLLDRTVSLIKNGASSDVHSGLSSGSMVRVIIS